VGILHHTPGLDIQPRQQAQQALSGPVVLERPDDQGLGSNGLEVSGHIGGAPKDSALPDDPDDRHGGLRRDPVHFPEEVLVQHQVAEHHHPEAAHPREQGLGLVPIQSHRVPPSGKVWIATSGSITGIPSWMG